MTSYSNCFSTNQNNSLYICATRLYHDNDKEADKEMDYRKKCVGNQQKDDQDQDDEQDDLLKQTWARQKWACCDEYLVQAGTKQAGCDERVQAETIGDVLVQNGDGGWGLIIQYVCNKTPFFFYLI